MTVEMEITKKAKEPKRFFILGPPMALLSFSQSLTIIVFTDLIVYRSCFIVLHDKINRTMDSCFLLRTNTSSLESVKLEAEIEPYAGIIIMTKSLIESLLPAITSLFLGPWSDRGGRRPLLLAGFGGCAIQYVMLFMISNWDMSPWYLLIPSVPACALGGQCTVSLASVCHITDTTAEKDRTVLLAWLQASIFGGLLFGIFSGPLIYEYRGYNAVFSTAAFCCISGLIYIYFCVPESVKNVSKVSVNDVFRISLLKTPVKCITVKRDGFRRSIVWLAVFIFTSSGMVYAGDLTIAFLFTRARLGWDVLQYSYLSGTGLILSIFGLCGISLLSPVMGVSDIFLAGMGLTSSLGSAIVKALSTRGWHIYTSAAIGMFSGITAPVMRSIISKSVPAEDVGKIFSLTALLETLSPLGGAPLFTLVYSNYLPPIYPSPVYLVAAGFYLLLGICLIFIKILGKESKKPAYVATAQEDH